MDWKKELHDGEAAFNRGQYKQAVALLDSVLPECEKAGPKRDLFNCLFVLGRTYSKLAKYTDSAVLLRRAAELASKEFGSSSVELAAAKGALGYDFIFEEKYAEAESLLNEALELIRQQVGSETKEAAETFSSLARLKLQEDRVEEALALFTKSLGIREHILGTDSAIYAETLVNLGEVHLRKRNNDSADVLLKRAVRVLEGFGEDNANLAMALHQRATQMLERGRYSQAAQDWQRAIPIIERTLSDDHPILIGSLNGLGTCKLRSFELQEAKPKFERAFNLAEKNRSHPNSTLTSALGLGMCLASEHNHKAAEPLFERAKQLFQETETNHSERSILDNLLACYLLQGKFGKAITLLPDQLRMSNESHLKRYVNLLNTITDLGERHAWKKSDEP